MKTKIILISKKKFYLILFSLVAILMFLILFTTLKLTSSDNTDQAIATSTSVTNEKAIKRDLNGDGKDDILYISTQNNKYYMEVLSNKKTLFLDPDKKLGTVGMHSNFWPMNISLVDLSRDKIPEILVQASQDKIPIQHIFSYYNGEYKDIYCGNHNVFGVLDSKNNKTPKLISMELKSKSMDVSEYLLVRNSLKEISPDNLTIPGLQNVMLFIDMIESSGEIDNVYDIFTSDIDEDSMSLIWKLDKKDYIYEFQDAFFNDTKWDEDGSVRELQWTLNFKKVIAQGDAEPSQVKIKITLMKEGPKYNINSLKIQKN